MGYRGKLIVSETRIELPTTFVEKYKEEYYIEEREGVYWLNISSKYEKKGHYNILVDLHALVKDSGFTVYAAILWEDGAFDRINLKTGKEKCFAPEDEYYL